MKPNKRKLFGTGAVILMILIAFSPIITGMQLNSEKEINSLNMGNGDHDLELTQNLVFVKFRAKPKEETRGFDYVDYKLDYIITNVGSGTFNTNSVSLK